MNSDHPTLGDLAYSSAKDAERRNKALAARVAELENRIEELVEWTELAAEAFNTLNAELDELKKRIENP